MAVDINAIMAGWVDRGLWYYYDTIAITQGATGAATYNPFSVPVGGTKTKLSTNMRVANSFPPPTCLILDWIGFYFSPDTRLADITTFINNYRFEFKIDNKIFFEGLLWMQPPGLGVSGMSTQTSESSWMLGMADFNSTLRFGDFAKYIAPQQLFTLEIISPAPPTFLTSGQGGNGVTLIPILHGLTDRSVQ